ncbi:MAG: hypothetical protein EBY17_17430 [Acidobacteriia bacterium]|jgi:hypothetical protein|nr:hypothetical protein [Terriglobia bacterium]
MRCLVLLLLGVVAVSAEVVDRTSVRVGTRIIASSEIDLRVRLAAFQNREKVEISVVRRREAARQLIDQRLVEREMELGHYPRLDAAQRAPLLIVYAAQAFGGDVGGLGASLASYGITPAELEADLARQADLLTFLGLRFRINDETRKGDEDLEGWIQDQRRRTVIEYLQRELAP